MLRRVGSAFSSAPASARTASGGQGEAKVHGRAISPWERVVRVGAEVVVRDE